MRAIGIIVGAIAWFGGGWLALTFALMFARCGPAPRAAIVEPNTHAACARAVRCQVFAENEYQTCVNCLEHVDPVVVARLRHEFGDLPPLDQVDCETLRVVCDDLTNIAQCVHEEWYPA